MQGIRDIALSLADRWLPGVAVAGAAIHMDSIAQAMLAAAVEIAYAVVGTPHMTGGGF